MAKRFPIKVANISAWILIMALGGCQTQGGFHLSNITDVMLKGHASSVASNPSPSTPTPAPRAPRLACNLSSDIFSKPPESVDWVAAYGQCPASSIIAYNAAVALLNHGDYATVEPLLKEATRNHPHDMALQRLYSEALDPFSAIARVADERMAAWLKRPSEVGKFTRTPPRKPAMPSLPKLIKSEFETTDQFQSRLEKAKVQRRHTLQKLESDYKQAVFDYNAAVKSHNAALKRERGNRLDMAGRKRLEFLSQAVSVVLGRPLLADLQYDADAGVFYGKVSSSTSHFDRRVRISVPQSAAARFKVDVSRLMPRLTFVLKGGSMVLKGVNVVHQGTSYAGRFTDETFQPVVMTAAIDVAAPRIKDLNTLQAETLDTAAVVRESDAYFDSALSLKDDPELAKLRQREAKLALRQREARAGKAREAERRRLEQNIQRQQEMLAKVGGNVGDQYKGMKPKKKWAFRRANIDGQDIVAVVIGNRNYGRRVPLVYYAHNDAKAVRQFLTQGMGVPPENVIYEEDATKGVMEGIFRARLRGRVEPGKTKLFVYFSGHGMPDESRDAELLPTDAQPNTARVTGYSRDLMLEQLAMLNPQSMTVVTDSCFSGTSKNGEALTAVKAILPEPRRARLPPNALLISASSGTQTSWMDDKTGLSLMTLYLLKGLSGEADENGDSSVSSAELAAYMKVRVNKAALLEHQQPQTPEVMGSEQIMVKY